MDAEHEDGKINLSNSPSSTSSSPSPEFSFHSPNKTDPPPSVNAIDLSPADDIFFHGHLLPLHLLSQFSISPRSSTNSLDNNFPLPLDTEENIPHETRERKKQKPFSLFQLGKLRKGRKVRDEEGDDKEKKMRFNIRNVLKRYVGFFRGRGENLNLRRQPDSFSGNLSALLKNKHGLGGGGYSAPASLMASPRNSVLVSTAPVSSSIRDGTMEELQAAIQAAIAHCKNSLL